MHGTFQLEHLKGRDRLGEIDIDERMVLSRPYGNEKEPVVWFHQARGRVQWRVITNAVRHYERQGSDSQGSEY